MNEALLVRRFERLGDLPGDGKSLCEGNRTTRDALCQRTLRATLQWSYSLLEPPEQRLLCYVSVFHEGWTLAAMERVCYGERERSLGEWQDGYEDGLAVGDEEATAEGIMGVGYCHLSGGQVDEAQPALAEAISRSSGGVSDFIHALSMTLEGMRRFATGDLEGGIALVERIETLKASIPKTKLDGIVADGSALSPAAVLTMIAE
jgi:hypothetical protein